MKVIFTDIFTMTYLEYESVNEKCIKTSLLTIIYKYTLQSIRYCEIDLLCFSKTI